MGPNNYNYQLEPSTSTPQSGPGKKKVILALIAAIILLVIAFIVLSLTHKPKTTTNNSNITNTISTMDIELKNLPDQKGLSATLNQLPVDTSTASSGTISKDLTKGDYTLVVKKPGYKTFSVKFSITPPQNTIINVNLQPAVDTTINSWGQLGIKDSPIEFDTGGLTASQVQNIKNLPTELTNVQYFYNKTWAVVTVTNGHQKGYEVVRYDFTRNTWVGVAGTSQYFSNSYVQGMPTKVQTYLSANNHTYPE